VKSYAAKVALCEKIFAKLLSLRGEIFLAGIADEDCGELVSGFKT
jgi:hypothetical protein